MEEENKETQEAPQETQQSSETSSQKQFNPMLLGGIFVAVIIVVAGFLFTRQKGNTVQTAGETSTQNETVTGQKVIGGSEVEEQVVEETGQDAGVQVVEVEGGAFYFKPNEIRVKQGDTVRIVFSNAGGQHDFTIDEFNVKTPLTQTGDTQEVEFVASQTGEFEFYCSVANHRAQGMVGTLIVE